MESYKADIDRWSDMWEKALKDEFKEDKPAPRANPDVSFFGMNSVDQESEVLNEIRQQDIDEWTEVADRTRELRATPKELLEEAKKPKKKKEEASDKAEKPAYDKEDGFASKLAKVLGDADQFIAPNPIHFASVGVDQKLRVTPNWTSGEVLAALAKVKSMMYDVECEMLTAEALGGNISTAKAKLDGLIKQFNDLSEKLTPDVTKDVS